MRLILLLGLILFSSSEVNGQDPVLVNDPEFQRATRAAIDSLYNRNPEAARELVKPWSKAHPGHPIWQLWEAMEVWWLVLTDLHDDSFDDELINKMQLADQAAERLLRQNPDHADGHIIRAVANGYIARQHSNRNRWVRSIRTARTAQKAHENLGILAPDLSDNLFAEGLKLYYAAYLPEAYSVVRAVSWLLPSGDKQEGLRLLELTSRDAVFARPESIYFLGVILLNYEHEYDEAVNRFQTLVDSYPRNSYYRRLLIRTLYQQQRDRAAIEEIDRTIQFWADHDLRDQQVLLEELLYWRGRVQMRSGRYEAALENFKKSYNLGLELPNRKNRSFHALSGYYAGITSEWSNDFSAARTYYTAVTELECEDEVRKRAGERLREL